MSFAESSECRLANDPALLLVGTAGQGKTHLLCDVAKRDSQESRPRLLFHGEQFRNDEPWSQMIRQLGLNCSRDEFLGALEAAAQANNCRVLVFIDALNEGEGNRLWQKVLPGMLTRLARRQWLGICVSVRSCYEPCVVPSSLDGSRLTRVEHTGFGELTDDAVATFFDRFGIEPSAPMLMPEFGNPLFLKLFCQGLQRAGAIRAPSGVRGITAVFGFLIESLDGKLSRPEWLDYDPRSRWAAKAVEHVADEMAKRKTDRLPLEDARQIVNELLPRDGHQRSLFHHLESESILTIVPDFRDRGDDDWTESVRFTHQRLSDHLIAQRLLARYLNKEKPKVSFGNRRTLGKILKDERTCWVNRGLLEAFAVQIPELTKKELPDLAPHLADLHPMREAFVESLVWRVPDSFTAATYRYIDNQVLRYRRTFGDFWNAAITLAPVPQHPLNADRLDTTLKRCALADRDAWWSVFLHEQWANERAVHRLVNWAGEDTDKSTFDDEVIRLAGVTLGWFFTTSNRFLRDRATKALVRLCENRIHVLRQIIGQLGGVDDPYVTERLAAVAYGCAMRTTDHAALSDLAMDVYRWVFESGTPPAHILLRDYARGVIELALHCGAAIEVDLAKMRPPYGSEWPVSDVPQQADLEPLSQWTNEMPDVQWARVHLYHSLMDEDFSRYVVGHLNHFSSERIDEPQKPTHRELHDQFVGSLTDRQKQAFDVYRTVHHNVDFCRRLEPDRRREHFGRDLTEAELDRILQQVERQLLKTLRRGTQKYRLFRESVAPYVSAPHKYDDACKFDGQLARRWMMRRIMDMGWTVERFGEFDRNVNRWSAHGRDAHKPERIGKKYQWIAYHELLARLSDNFRLRQERWSGRNADYNGSWDVGCSRNIDPSNLLRQTQRDEWRPHTNAWWFPTTVDRWDDPDDEVAWLKTTGDLPCATDLIQVTNPRDGSRWLALDGYYRWEQPVPPGVDRYEFRRREMHYMLRCYLVRATDSGKLFRWARKQSWFRRSMPEPPDSYGIMLGEHFWSPMFSDQDCEYYGRQGWTGASGHEMPAEVLVTADTYGWEVSGHDCSVEGTIHIDMPCRYLVDAMGLEWRGKEGNWYDRTGVLTAFDPSVRERGPGVLVVRRESLLGFLKTHNLALLWTVLGERRVLPGSFSRDEHHGLLEINGAYTWKDEALAGGMRTKFIAPHGRG